MTPSLEGRPTKAKETPSPHEVRLAPLGTNPVFQYFALINMKLKERVMKLVMIAKQH